LDETREFLAEPGSVAVVRQFVRQTLGALDAATVEDGVLLTGEIASNVVEHARTDYQVRVTMRAGRVRIEVADGSSVLPAVRDLANDADRGRGLLLLERIATEWGVDQRPNGKAVWFELEPSIDLG
jgi:anti-sigma regulatory factor (Ser/Thr protein kinase)